MPQTKPHMIFDIPLQFLINPRQCSHAVCDLPLQIWETAHIQYVNTAAFYFQDMLLVSPINLERYFQGFVFFFKFHFLQLLLFLKTSISTLCILSAVFNIGPASKLGLDGYLPTNESHSWKIMRATAVK